VVRERGPELQALTDAWFVAQGRLLADPAGSLRLIAKALGQPDSSLSIGGVRFLDREENRRRFAAAPGAQALVTTVEDYERFFGQLGRLRRRVDATRAINAEFLR
jgi:hypothetical protein